MENANISTIESKIESAASDLQYWESVVSRIKNGTPMSVQHKLETAEKYMQRSKEELTLLLEQRDKEQIALNNALDILRAQFLLETGEYRGLTEEQLSTIHLIFIVYENMPLTPYKFNDENGQIVTIQARCAFEAITRSQVLVITKAHNSLTPIVE